MLTTKLELVKPKPFCVFMQSYTPPWFYKTDVLTAQGCLKKIIIITASRKSFFPIIHSPCALLIQEIFFFCIFIWYIRFILLHVFNLLMFIHIAFFYQDLLKENFVKKGILMICLEKQYPPNKLKNISVKNDFYFFFKSCKYFA